MEAAGVDCFALSEPFGWEVYPIGRSAPSAIIPAVSLVGLVPLG